MLNFKKKITFRIDGKKETVKVRRLSVGVRLEELEDGSEKWRSLNYISGYRIFFVKNQDGTSTEQHVFDRHGNELKDDDSKNEEPEQREDVEVAYNDEGKISVKKIPGGYIHYFNYGKDGELSEIRIEKDGKVCMTTSFHWTDDRKFKITKTKNFHENENVKYIVKQFFYDKKGKEKKVILYD